MTAPRDPIAAVTHPDPLSYYALLAARQPFYRDEALDLWVAAGSEAVTAVLASPFCHVRPPQEPVPRTIVGSPAEDIFRHLVRMRDGEGHRSMKAVIVRALATVRPQDVERMSRILAAELIRHMPADEADLAHYAFSLPVQTIASLLGFSAGDLPRITHHLTAFVAGLSPLAGPDRIDAAKGAAGHLMAKMRAHLESREHCSDLLGALITGAREAGCDDPGMLAANAIGLMMQSQEATAGLIGNTLLNLARNPDLRLAAEQDEAVLAAAIEDVLWRDPPIQNTRRFVAEDGVIAGQAVKRGDGILVILAAAQRNPREVERAERKMFAFGEGRHACPARIFATIIAKAGVAHLLAGQRLTTVPAAASYRSSVNARIPF